MDASSWLEFVRLPGFIRDAKGILDENDESRLERALIENPLAGAVVSGTGGLRKYRFAIGSRGKSGSTRVIYYYRSNKGRIYLVKIYRKADKSSLTLAEKGELKKLVHSANDDP